MEVKNAKNIFFNSFWPSLVTNELLSWPIEGLYGVMSIRGSMGDIMG